MQRLEDKYALLKVAYSDMEYTLICNFLKANGIQVTIREKGFGGPIRSLFMGSFTPANIEIFVDKADYETARTLLDTDYSEVVDDYFDLENPIA